MLHPRMQRWVYEQGWQVLRDVQERAVAPILAGDRDVILCASTAAGKTEAAFLPILSALAAARDEPRSPRSVEVLCVSPLKALINDQYDRLDLMCEQAGIEVHRWHGDVAQSAKLRALAAGSGVLLITPESLEAIFVNRGSQVKSIFTALRYVVIDERHSFLGVPRGAQLQSLLNRVELAIRRRPLRIALSATLADIDNAKAYLRPTRPEGVVAIEDESGSGLLHLQVRGYLKSPPPHKGDASPENVESQTAESEATDGLGVCGKDEIARHIFEQLRGRYNLVFANRRRDVEEYADRLRRLSEAGRVPNEFWPHHGSLSRPIREDAEEALKDASRPATGVCTSTLEMGIDIGALDSVAQIDVPPSVASMRQRLGRSGRRGEPAVLRIYVTEKPDDPEFGPVDALRWKVVQTVAMVRLMLDGWLEAPDDPGFNYSTLVQQVLSVIAQHGGASASDLHGALRGPGPFELVDESRFSRLLRAMVAKDLIIEASGGLLLHGEKGERIVNHFGFYAAFETAAEWRLVADGKTLGSMPINHVVQEGALLIFAGRRWRITRVDESRRVIELAPSSGGKPPGFDGSGPQVSRRVREEMVVVYKSDDMPAWLDPCASELLSEGRAAWRRFGLSATAVLDAGSDVLLFPWTSDRALHTVRIALTSAGLRRVETSGPALQINGGSVREIGSVARVLLEQGPPDPMELARNIANRRIDKWDWALDDVLLTESAGARLLDVHGAWEVLAKISEDLS